MEEKSKNNPILDVLCGLGLALWAIAFFAGFTFYRGGEFLISLIVSILLLAVMSGMIVLAKRSCVKNDKNSQCRERVAITIYALASLASLIFICHFIKVNFSDKANIQDVALKQIQELKGLFGTDSEVGKYEIWVNEQAEDLKNSLSGTDKGTIETRVSDLKVSLLTSSGFDDLKQYACIWLDNSFKSIDSWNWFTVARYLSELSKNKHDYEARVVECSKSSNFTAEAGFPYASEHQEGDLSSSLRKVSVAADISFLSVLAVVICQVLILLSYFLSKPNWGHSPQKYKGKAKTISSFDPNNGGEKGRNENVGKIEG